MKQWPTLYVKTASGALGQWTIWTEGSNILMEWGQVGGQMQQNSTPAEAKNTGRANATTAAEQAIKEAEARYNKQLRLKYVDSMEGAEKNLNIKPMRAYSLDEKRQKKLRFPITCQPKYDGCRLFAYPKDGPGAHGGVIRLMSRGGLDYTLPHVANELMHRIPKRWILDGELYCHGMSLQTIRHHIETYTQESSQVYMICYDFFCLDEREMPWRVRQDALLDFFMVNSGMSHIRLSPSIEVGSMEDLDHLHDAWVGQGYEGLIAREMDGPYMLASKSTNLLKYKKFDDAEFEVVNWSLGKDGIIQYTCKTKEGKLFEARPMGSEEERAQLLVEAQAGLAVGKQLTVRYMGYSDDKIPLHPRGVAFRPPKDLDE